MASPFNVFRRNQKIMLAVLGIMAMFAFVFIPIMMRLAEDKPKGEGLAVTTKYGPITEQQLGSMVRNRQVLNEFFGSLMRQTINVMQQKGQQPQAIQMYAFQTERGLFERGLLGDPSEESVLNSLILARRAEEMGIVISDLELNKFLIRLTQNQLTSDQITQVITSLRATPKQMFNVMRQEMLSAKLQELFSYSLQSGYTPAQRWDYFRRLRRRASAEVAAVPVAQFVTQVPEPTEAELVKFFESRKEAYPEPGSPKFGFHHPKRANLQYFRAEYEKFLDKDAITVEEIAAHYEKFKDTRYLWTQEDFFAPPVTTEAPQDEPAGEQPASTSEAPPETPAGTEPQATTEPPADTPAGDTPSEPTDAPAEPAPQSEGTSEQEAPQTPESPSPMAVRGGLLRALPLALLKTVLLQDPPTATDSPAATEPPVATEPPAATEPPVATTPAEGTAPAESTPPAQTPETPAPTTAGGAPPGSVPATTPAVPVLRLEDLAVDYTLPQDVREGPNPKYDPLWKVEDRIREELANEKATEKMRQALEPLRSEMETYAEARLRWSLDQDRKETSQEPVPLDFAALAAQHPGISSGATGLVSAAELQQIDGIGRAATDNGQSIVESVFANVRTYSTQYVQDQAGNRYIFWVSESTADQIPTFAEAKAEVLKAWKFEQARPLARKAAEALAAKAQSAASLKEGLASDPNIKVELTGSFSWMTEGGVPFQTAQVPPRISQVPNVDQPGNEFMLDVFRLAEGETGVAMNGPESVAYVVRVLQYEPSEVVLRERFLAEQLSTYTNAGRPEQRDVYLAWVDQIKSDAGVSWVRQPLMR
ncbi:MAG: hypothetical protein K1X74_11320 [Pirellulales bacterium]|nr:hypothetical protein [Pirellulales bacterium]